MKSSKSNPKRQAREVKVNSSRSIAWINLYICVALLLAAIAVYAPVRNFQFVNFDDADYISKNSHVAQGLSGDSVRWAFTSGDAANWFPVTRLSHIIDYQLFGLDSGTHHLMNVAFHAFAAVFAFLFLHCATRCRWPSAAVAFLFATHPLHVESVAWVAERKDTLSALFWFLSLWLYVRYAEEPSRSRYGLALGSFCLDLMSKPMAITLPIVMLLLDYWPLRRRPAIREKVPFFVLAAVSGIITYTVQRQGGAVETLAHFPLPLRVANALASYLVYLAQTLWPTRLAVFYPYPNEVPIWTAVSAIVLIGGISGLVWKMRGRRPYLLTGWFWFIVTLLPVIGIVQVGAQSHADRYMYLPMTGLLIAVAWGILDLTERWPRMKPVAFAASGLACAGCVAAAEFQLQNWRNSGTLFEHALAVTKNNYIAEHSLGNYLLQVPGQLPRSIEHLKRALEINPNSVPARSDLGIALARSGRPADALNEFQTAAQNDPKAEIAQKNLQLATSDFADQHYNRGIELMKAHQTSAAVTEFQESLRLRPNYAEAHNNLGVAYSSIQGNLREAIAEFEQAVKLNPDYLDAQYNFAVALSQAPGHEREALTHFKIVERLRPDPEVEQVIRQLSAETSGH